MSLIYTIGHSTRSIQEFIQLLTTHHIQLVIDVRRYASSRRFPQFNKGDLQESLYQNKIGYKHYEVLGGRRGAPNPQSLNDGLQDEGIRAYADYINTVEGRKAVDWLSETTANYRLALLCAEKLPPNCHRNIIADVLVAKGMNVFHILDKNKTEVHKLHQQARLLNDGRVIFQNNQERLF